MTKTINIRPTWSGILPMMLAVISNPKASKESRKVIIEELERMATYADNWVALKDPIDK